MTDNRGKIQYVYKIKNFENFLFDFEKFEMNLSMIYTKLHKKGMNSLKQEMLKKSKSVVRLTDFLRINVGLLSGSNEMNSSLEGRKGEVSRILAKLHKNRRVIQNKSALIHAMNLKHQESTLKMLYEVNLRTRNLGAKMENTLINVNTEC